jgi:hypothetical protein
MLRVSPGFHAGQLSLTPLSMQGDDLAFPALMGFVFKIASAFQISILSIIFSPAAGAGLCRIVIMLLRK